MVRALSSSEYSTMFGEFSDFASPEDTRKEFPKIRLEVKGTSLNSNTKNNFMARYCHSCTFLEGISFEQHNEIQITFSL